MSSPRVPPRFVPTLTEVVEFGDALVVGDVADGLPEPAVASTPIELAGGAAEQPLPSADPSALVMPAEPALHLTAEALAFAVAPPLSAVAPAVVPDLALDAAQHVAPEPETVVESAIGAPVVVANGAAPVGAVQASPEPDHHPAVAVSTEDVPAFLLAAPGFGGTAPAAPEPSRPPEAPAPVASPVPPVTEVPPALDAGQEEQIVHNVLAELQRRTDLMLEYRLREALSPILARLCDTLIKEAREDLAATLRDVVARAVAQELGRHRSK